MKKKVFLLLLVVFLAYLPVMRNGFVWDDEEQVLANPYIKSFANLPQIFSGSTFNTGGAGLTGWYFKPLMSLWFMINWRLFGPHAWGFHLLQLLLHLVNCYLLYSIFRKFLGKNLAFWLVLLFGLHPANVEAVAYISASQELLFSFFLLLAWTPLRWIPIDTLGIPLIFFLLSLLSKETGLVGLPLVFLFYLFIKKDRHQGLLWLIYGGAVFGFYLFWRLLIAKIPFSARSLVVPIAVASFKNRLLTIPFEIVSYLRLIFWPLKLMISRHQVVRQLPDPRFWVNLPVAIIFIGALIWLFFKNNKNKFFVAWFLLPLLLVLNLFPLDMTIAERWLYFPLMGFAGLMGLILKPYWYKNKHFSFAAALVALIFFCLTFSRTLNWRNGLSLYAHDIKLNPEAFDLQNNYGVELFRIGKMAEAQPHFEKSIELSPNWWTAYNNLGVIYQRKGDYSKAKELYRLSIAKGDYYLAYENLAALILQTEGPKKAEEFCQSALQILPNNLILQQILKKTP